MEEEVKLLGYWASPFSKRVEWALKLKGVEYDYIEEDVFNKSQLLLQYNPVHKKIPVLIHGGKTICESLVILEYIEQTWPQTPLLPKDPYQRALDRFWMQFADEKLPTFSSLFTSPTGGEKGEKAAKEVAEMFKILEERLGNDNFFGGETMNMVDIAQGWLAYWFQFIEKSVGLEILEPNTFPRFHTWAQNFKQLPIIKDSLPDYNRLLIHMKSVREKSLAKTE